MSNRWIALAAVVIATGGFGQTINQPTSALEPIPDRSHTPPDILPGMFDRSSGTASVHDGKSSNPCPSINASARDDCLGRNSTGRRKSEPAAIPRSHDSQRATVPRGR